MSAELVWALIATFVVGYLSYHVYKLVHFVQVLYMLREGEKLACFMYGNMLKSVIEIKGVAKLVNKDTTVDFDNPHKNIAAIVETNAAVESKLYPDLRRRGLIADQEARMENIKTSFKK